MSIIGSPEQMQPSPELAAAAGNALTGAQLDLLLSMLAQGSITVAAAKAKIEQHLRAAPQAAQGEGLTRDQIRSIFMAHGFTIKEGQTDLKQYVYDAANALIDVALVEAAKEAEHWQRINTSHKCGEYIAAAILGKRTAPAAPSAAQASVRKGLADILREASAIIGAIPVGHEPVNMRFPIVDELLGFAGMLTTPSEGVAAPVEPTFEQKWGHKPHCNLAFPATMGTEDDFCSCSTRAPEAKP